MPTIKRQPNRARALQVEEDVGESDCYRFSHYSCLPHIPAPAVLRVQGTPWPFLSEGG